MTTPNDVGAQQVLIAGASGLIGHELTTQLQNDGHAVRRLVRRVAKSAEEVSWDPASGQLDVAAVSEANVIINLSGENVAAGRWTRSRREGIMQSRVEATRTLVAAIRSAERKPALLVNASAVGFYGDRGDEELTEASAMGVGFLPEVCLAWETHAQGAQRAGVRTALMRFGVVLAREGGALRKLLPLFRVGLGGRQGRGEQWMSWIAIDDVIGAIRHVIGNSSCEGVVNTVAPNPVRNAEFARALARVLRRPAVLPAPAFALRAAFGAMADEALLASARVKPARLLETGYVFQQPTLESALRHLLSRPSPGKL